MSQRKELISYIFMGPEDDPGHIQGDQMSYQTPNRGGDFRSHLQDGHNDDHQLDPEEREHQEQLQVGEPQNLKNHILYLLGELDHEKNSHMINGHQKSHGNPGYVSLTADLDHKMDLEGDGDGLQPPYSA